MKSVAHGRARVFMNPWLLFRASRLVCILAVSGVAALQQGVPDRATGGVHQLETSSSALSAIWSQLMLGGQRLASSLEFSGIEEAPSGTFQRRLDASSTATRGVEDEPHLLLPSLSVPLREEAAQGDGRPGKSEAVVDEARRLQDVSPASAPDVPAPAESSYLTRVWRVASFLAARKDIGNTGGYAVAPQTCSAYVNTMGNTLCPGGSSPVGSGVSCGTGTECNQATCCEAAVPPPTPAPFAVLTPVPTPSPTPAPTNLPDEIPAVTTVAAGAVSTLALGGLVISTGSTLLGGGASASMTTGGTGDVENAVGAQSTASVRQPSATLALMLVAQIQFLATLSLVNNTGAKDSTLSGFVDKLRWVNLWPPASFAESFIPASEPILQARSLRLQIASDEFEPGEEEASGSTEEGISSAVFLGNFTLFVALLSSIFLVHVVLASAIEAYWLAKKRAEEQIERANQQGIPISQLSVRPTGRQVQHDPNAEASQRSLLWIGSSGEDEMLPNDEDEEGGKPRSSRRRSSVLNMNKVAECREKSQSAWLHFPHVELVFLFFAFEGAVASQVSAIRENDSPAVFSLAMASLLLYPVLMIVMVSRTFAAKVRTADHIVFKPIADDAGDESGGTFFSGTRSFGVKVRTSLKEDHSMFAWADKGQWKSVETSDRGVQQERDWFRIGFEPIFVDFTDKGSWFVVYTLIEWVALGVVGAVVEDSVLQLSLFCGMHTVSCLLLVILKPFANRVINAMGIALYGIDAACMAILAVAADKWEGSSRAEEVDSAVTIVQLVTLAAIIIPIYVDTAFMMAGALWQKMRKTRKVDAQKNEEERMFTKRYVRRAWARIWCIMLRKNTFACFRDTAAGVKAKKRGPAGATAAQSGPYPPVDLSEDFGGPEGFQPRRLGGKSVGTMSTPVVVPSPRSEVIGQNASAWGIMWKTPVGREPQFTASASARTYTGTSATEGASGRYRSQEQGDHLERGSSSGRGLLSSGGRNVPHADCDSSSPWSLSAPRFRFATKDDVVAEKARAQSRPDGLSASPVFESEARDMATGPSWNKRGGPVPSDLPMRRSTKYAGSPSASSAQVIGGNDLCDTQSRHETAYEDASEALGEGFFDAGAHHKRLDETSSGAASMRRMQAGGIQSDDLPRRRQYMMPTMRADGSGDGDEQDKHDMPVDQSSTDRRKSGKRGVERWGLNNRGPLISDLPRRRSGYSSVASTRSMGSADIISQPRHPFEEPAEQTGTLGGQEHGDIDSEPGKARLDEPSDTGGRATSRAASMRRMQAGGIQSDGLPRRRQYMMRTMRADEHGDGDEQDEHDMPVDQSSTDRRKSGSGDHWGPKNGGLLAIDLPRRRSGYSSVAWARSMGGTDVESQSRHPFEEPTEQTGAPGGQGHGGIDSEPREVRLGEPSESMRYMKAGGIQSDDLPRRRQYMMHTMNVDKCGDGDEQDEHDMPMDRISTNRRKSERGSGERWGLKNGGPEVSDLPRRRSGYSSVAWARSMGGTDVESQSRHPFDEPTEYTGTYDGQEHGDIGSEPGDARLDGPSTAGARSSSGAASMRYMQAGEIQSNDLPRRREYIMPTTKMEESDKRDEQHEQHEHDMPVDQIRSNRSEWRKGGGDRWGLKNRGPLASDLPRRRSGYSSVASARSMGGTDGNGQSRRAFEEPTEQTGTPDGQEHGDFGSEPGDARLDRTSTTGARSSSLVQAKRKRWGRIQSDDLPRRRECTVPTTIEVESGDRDEQDERDGPADQIIPNRHESGTVGGERRGLKNRGPLAIDLPRRRSGYSSVASTRSMVGADVDSQSSPARQQPTDRDSVGDWEGHGVSSPEPGSIRLGRTSRSGSTPFPLAESMRHVLGGAVEHDLPRRRPTKYPLSGRERAVAGDERAGQEEDNDSGLVVAASQGRRRDNGGSARFGLRSRVPIASEFPRRHSDHLSVASAAHFVGGTDVTETQQPPPYEELEGHHGTIDGQVHGGFDPEPSDTSRLSETFRTGGASSFLAESVRHMPGGGVQSDDLPRRRELMMPTTIDDESGDRDQHGEHHMPVGQIGIINRIESGRGGGERWALKNRRPLASDFPRRRSGYSSVASARSIGGVDVDSRSQQQPTDLESVSDGEGHGVTNPEPGDASSR